MGDGGLNISSKFLVQLILFGVPLWGLKYQWKCNKNFVVQVSVTKILERYLQVCCACSDVICYISPAHISRRYLFYYSHVTLLNGKGIANHGN